MLLHVLLHRLLFNLSLALGDIVTFQVHHVIVADLKYKHRTSLLFVFVKVIVKVYQSFKILKDYVSIIHHRFLFLNGLLT